MPRTETVGDCTLYLGDKRKRIGRDHPLYRGGKYIDGMGYVILGSKEWGKDQGRREHQVVMEQKLGRPLRRGDIVHHVNGVKTDNRPENLELHTRASHNREHGTGASYSCWNCGAQRWYSPSVAAKLKIPYQCRQCWNISRGAK